MWYTIIVSLCVNHAVIGTNYVLLWYCSDASNHSWRKCFEMLWNVGLHFLSYPQELWRITLSSLWKPLMYWKTAIISPLILLFVGLDNLVPLHDLSCMIILQTPIISGPDNLDSSRVDRWGVFYFFLACFDLHPCSGLSEIFSQVAGLLSLTM